jgi:hypothetical protein
VRPETAACRRMEASHMNKRRLCPAALWLILGAAVGVPAPGASASEAGMAAAEQVSVASYRDFLDNWLFTRAGDNRGFGAEHDPARDNIEAFFLSFGYDVVLHPFQYSSVTYYNVVATKTGTVHPNQEYIVGAHYDSVDNPGADDDASGTAALLEIARIISQYDSAYTIRFIAFDREEQGLVGSYAYVADVAGADILGMVQADMIAYNLGNNAATIHGGGGSTALKNAMVSAVNEYGDGLIPVPAGASGGSDHAPFENAGYEAVLLIEEWGNPNYHTPDDNVDVPNYIDYPYAVRHTRSIVGWLVDAAEVDIAVEEVVSPNVYDAVLPWTNCPGVVMYYFSADSVSGSTYNWPRTAPGDHFSSLAAYGIEVFFSEDFEDAPGWTTEVIGATSGHWQRGVPVNDPGWEYDPQADSDGSGQCYLTQNEMGNTDVDDGAVRLTSANFDMSGGGTLAYDYYLNLTNAAGGVDMLLVEGNNTGGLGPWIEIARHDTSGGLNWRSHEITTAQLIVAGVPPTTEMKVRFTANDADPQSINESGVDALRIQDFDCTDPCPSDVNGDGTVNVQDFLGLLADWGGTGGPADVNKDGTVNVEDFLQMLAEWGPCP